MTISGLIVIQTFYAIIPVPLGSRSLRQCCKCVFRWFKFTLKPPYRITHENLLSLIWDTSHWNSFLKFGLRTAYDMS